MLKRFEVLFLRLIYKVSTLCRQPFCVQEYYYMCEVISGDSVLLKCMNIKLTPLCHLLVRSVKVPITVSRVLK